MFFALRWKVLNRLRRRAVGVGGRLGVDYGSENDEEKSFFNAVPSPSSAHSPLKGPATPQQRHNFRPNPTTPGVDLNEGYPMSRSTSQTTTQPSAESVNFVDSGGPGGATNYAAHRLLLTDGRPTEIEFEPPPPGQYTRGMIGGRQDLTSSASSSSRTSSSGSSAYSSSSRSKSSKSRSSRSRSSRSRKSSGSRRGEQSERGRIV